MVGAPYSCYRTDVLSGSPRDLPFLVGHEESVVIGIICIGGVRVHAPLQDS